MSLANDYVSLSKEAGRRQADVRDSAEKAANLIKANQAHAFADLATGKLSYLHEVQGRPETSVLILFLAARLAASPPLQPTHL